MSKYNESNTYLANKYSHSSFDHPTSAGNYVIFCKQTGWTRYSSNLDYLLHHYHLSKDLDYYTCYNTFKKRKHTDTNVLGLNAIWLDFDTLNQGMSVQMFQYAIPMVIELMELPEPNHVIMSGHGFHFIWFFDQPRYVHNRKFLKVWKHLEANIIHLGCEACKELFGKPDICDTSVRNPSRLMRLNNTYNNKGYNHIKVHRVPEFESPAEYSMQWYVDEFMTKWIQKSSNSAEKSAHSNFNTYIHNHKKYRGKHNTGTLNWDRHYDLERLPLLQHGNCKGHRDLILFNDMLHMSHIMTDQEVFKHMDIVNHKFADPLPDGIMKMLKREYKDIDFREYKCRTNQSLITALHITKAQQKHLLTIKANTRGTDKLHHNAHLTRVATRKCRNQKIMKLHQQGLSIRKIAKRVNIGKSAISSILKRF